MADARHRWLVSATLAGLPLAALVVAAAACEACSKRDAADVANAADAGSSVVDAAPRVIPDGGLINASPLTTAAVAGMLNPEKLPPYTGLTASIEGTITVTGDPAPATPSDFTKCPDAEKSWGHAFREGAPSAAHGPRPLGDAVVVVTGYRGFYIPEKDESREVRIEGCGFTTRTKTLTFGQRLEIKNDSNDFWTPVLEPGSNMVLMMAPPHGDPTRVYPKKPGHYLLMDRDRKYAVVDVYAFLHPLHTASDVSGHYRIDGVPVGKLKVSTTHPQIDANAEREIEVTAGVVHKVDLVLKNVTREAGAPDAGGDAGAYHPILR